MRYIVLISLSLVVSSCGIGGQWMNGNPRAGKNIKPYLHYWEKGSMTEDGRRADSRVCGAGATVYGADHVAFSREQASTEMKVNERDDLDARERLRDIWKSCMKNKGYNYVR